MPRDALIDELFREAQATVVLEGAKALIAYLAGLNAGRFTRIDIDFESGLAEWVESLGLLRVDAVTTMRRGAPLSGHSQTRLYAVVTQALG